YGSRAPSMRLLPLFLISKCSNITACSDMESADG
ncbi:MAG: hypothetical protein ACI9A2_001112, partial [Halioglobus sp.]